MTFQSTACLASPAGTSGYSRLPGVGTLALVGYFDNSWLAVIPFVVAALLGWHRYSRIRCPRCLRRLRARVVALDDLRDRFFYDCLHCRITWDPKYITQRD